MLLLLLLKVCELDRKRMRDVCNLPIIVNVVVAVADEISAENSIRDV
jgi:hypothetical protein